MEEFEPIEKMVLRVMKLSISHAVDEMEFVYGTKPDLEVLTDCIAASMVFKLNAKVAYRELPEIRYPKNWVEAIKQRWAPEWFLKRYPVKYTVYDAKVFYPDIVIPDHQEYVQVYKKEVMR